MSSKNYVLAALVLAVIGCTGLAWNQYRELVELRAAALNPLDREELQNRIGDLESQNRQLQDELAALQTAPPGDVSSLGAGDGTTRPAERNRPRAEMRERGPGGGQQKGNNLRELTSKPEVQALLRVQQEAAIDARYAALFRNLNLAPDQIAKLKNLLAERQSTLQDVMIAAREQGVDPRSDPEVFRKLIADAQNEINGGIKSLVGENGFSQLQTYEQTLPQRGVVNDLQQRLSFTDTPLTPSQAEQLVHILAANQPQRAEGAPARPGLGLGGPGLGIAMGGGRGGSSAVTSAAVAQAQGVLAPSQLAALQQIQQQQQSQQQLQQLLRNNQRGQNRDGPASGGNSTGGPATPKSGGG